MYFVIPVCVLIAVDCVRLIQIVGSGFDNVNFVPMGIATNVCPSVPG